MRFASLIGPELETLLRENPAEAHELLDEIHPEDVADIVQSIDAARGGAMLAALPPEYSAAVLERLDEEQQRALARVMGLDKTSLVAAEMGADDRADFFSQLPPAIAEPLLERLEKLDPEAAQEVESLTRWPETSAGGLMTTDYIALPPELTAGEAIDAIRSQAAEAETIATAYVCDAADRLVGVVGLVRVLLAAPDAKVADIMVHNVISVPPEMDQEAVARKLQKYDFTAMPVVDDAGVMLGVITSDDVIDVLTAEQSEDVQKMAAVEPIPDTYFDTPLWTLVRKRIPWLLILFFGGFLTTAAMERFDAVLRGITQLAFYVPLIVSTGGNSGAQSGTLVIRGLAIGEVRTRDWYKVLYREVAQGGVMGILLAAFGAAWVLLNGHGTGVAVLVAVTVVGLVVTGCVVGGMMPLALHRVGIDPATSSTPFIATLVDVLGVVIYLGLARWLLMDLAANAAATGL